MNRIGSMTSLDNFTTVSKNNIPDLEILNFFDTKKRSVDTIRQLVSYIYLNVLIWEYIYLHNWIKIFYSIYQIVIVHKSRESTILLNEYSTDNYKKVYIYFFYNKNYWGLRLFSCHTSTTTYSENFKCSRHCSMHTKVDTIKDHIWINKQ